MGTTTRINAFRELAERLYLNELDVVTGTASATTSTTSLKDATRLAYTDADASAYDRCWVYAMAAADASTRGFTRVTRGGYAAAGTLALNPALTGLATTDLYVITRDHPDILFAAIDAVLRNTYMPCFFPLSLHLCTSDDNDMETAPATSFLGNASDATLLNETTIVKNGGQSMAVVADADGGYTHFGNFGVNEGESLYAGIDCYVTSGDSATFRLIDVTNSNATVEDATTDEVKWMELVYPFTAPSGCEQIHARIIGDTSGDAVYVNDYHVWKSGIAVYKLPSWIIRPSQLIDFRAFPQGTGGPASDNDYRVNERASQAISWGLEREDIRANKPLLIWANCTSARPYVYALRPLSELATDAATTTADKDKVVDLAADLIRNPEEGYKRLRNHVAAILTAPDTRISPRFGVRIR